MFNIQLSEIFRNVIVKTLNEKGETLFEGDGTLMAADDRIQFNIYLDVQQDPSLLPVPVSELKGLHDSLRKKLPAYIGISQVRFK